MKYTLLVEAYHLFEKAVNRHLSDGWELYGNPFVDRNGYFCQAMIKRS